MKRILLFLAAAACLATGCHRAQKFTVQGNLKDINFYKVDSLRMESDQLEKPMFIAVNDRDFVFKGSVKEAAIGKIFPVGISKRNQFLILEKGTITFKDGLACGTPLNDSTAAFTARLKALKDKFPNPEDKELRQKAFEDEFFKFVTQHKDDPCAAYAILLAKNRMSKESLSKLIQTASPHIQNDGDVSALKKILTMTTN